MRNPSQQRPAAIIKMFWESIIVVEETALFLDPVYLERMVA